MSEGSEITKKVIKRTGSSGEILGEVTVVPDKKGGFGGWIRGLFVAENSRNRGLGGQLVDEALEYAGGRAGLEVESDNDAAIGLYINKGFHVVNQVTGSNGKVYLKMRKD